MAADASRDALEEKIDNFFQVGPYVVEREVCDDQTHAAVDVESNATGRDHTALVHIHGRNAADREPVAAVAVGHAKRVARDARQRGDIADLLVNGFVHFAHELFCRDDPRRYMHALFVSHRYFPDGIRDFSHFVDDAHVNCVLTKDRFPQPWWMIRIPMPTVRPACRGRLVWLALPAAAPAGSLCGPGCELRSGLEKRIHPPEDILVAHHASHALHARGAFGIAHAEHFEYRIRHLLDIVGIHQDRAGLELLGRTRKLAKN